jgi:hypothetical protein
MKRIRFRSDQIYESGGIGKGPKFAKDFVLDANDVGKVLSVDKPTDEFVDAFLERWVRRDVAEYVDGRAKASPPEEVAKVDEAPEPPKVSAPLGASKGTPHIDDGKQVGTKSVAIDPLTTADLPKGEAKVEAKADPKAEPKDEPKGFKAK